MRTKRSVKKMVAVWLLLAGAALPAVAAPAIIDVRGRWCGTMKCTFGVPNHIEHDTLCVDIDQVGSELNVTIEDNPTIFVGSVGGTPTSGMISVLSCGATPSDFASMAGSVTVNGSNGVVHFNYNQLILDDGSSFRSCDVQHNRVD